MISQKNLSTIKLSNAVTQQQLEAVRSLYEASFPSSEKKPFSMILEKRSQGVVEILAIESENGIFCGLAILAQYRDLALLDYFAVVPDMRGNGIGETALALLKEHCRSRRFFLEIENPAVRAANSEQRKRRKHFYLRNGMTLLPFRVNLFGTEMEILTDACTLSFDEYRELYLNVYSPSLVSKIQLLP